MGLLEDESKSGGKVSAAGIQVYLADLSAHTSSRPSHLATPLAPKLNVNDLVLTLARSKSLARQPLRLMKSPTPRRKKAKTRTTRPHRSCESRSMPKVPRDVSGESCTKCSTRLMSLSTSWTLEIRSARGVSPSLSICEKRRRTSIWCMF